ncbi:unnamed protein product [Ectocarpus sp. 12 AP-2014]
MTVVLRGGGEGRGPKEALLLPLRATEYRPEVEATNLRRRQKRVRADGFVFGVLSFGRRGGGRATVDLPPPDGSNVVVVTRGQRAPGLLHDSVQPALLQEDSPRTEDGDSRFTLSALISSFDLVSTFGLSGNTHRVDGAEASASLLPAVRKWLVGLSSGRRGCCNNRDEQDLRCVRAGTDRLGQDVPDG